MAKIFMKKRGFEDAVHEPYNAIDLHRTQEMFRDYTFEYCGSAPPYTCTGETGRIPDEAIMLEITPEETWNEEPFLKAGYYLISGLSAEEAYRILG